MIQLYKSIWWLAYIYDGKLCFILARMQTKSRSNGRAFSPRHLFSAAIHVCVHASPFLRKYTHHLWSVSPQSQIISCLVHRFQFFLLSLFSPPFISFCCIKSLGCVAIMGRAAPSSLCCRASIQPFHFPLWMHTVKKKTTEGEHILCLVVHTSLKILPLLRFMLDVLSSKKFMMANV